VEFEVGAEPASSDIMEPKMLLNFGVGWTEPRIPEGAAARLAGADAMAADPWISGMFTAWLVHMGNQTG
jgi:hypothetical protein